MIIPHAYMPKPGFAPVAHDFYKTLESELFDAVSRHYIGTVDGPPSPFSSWAASLHLVLSYARYSTSNTPGSDPHIAVMDSQDLDDGILIWHVPHLYDGTNEEYLAYGCVSGPGYAAVSLKTLEQNGLMSLFPQLKAPLLDMWGDELRLSMFELSPESISSTETRVIRNIAKLFGALSLPVAIALANLRPRPQISWPKMEDDSACPDDVKKRLQSFSSMVGIYHLPEKLGNEICHSPGMVDTDGCEDVEAWIGLLHALCKSGIIELEKPVRKSRKRKREDDHDSEQEIKIDAEKVTQIEDFEGLPNDDGADGVTDTSQEDSDNEDSNSDDDDDDEEEDVAVHSCDDNDQERPKTQVRLKRKPMPTPAELAKWKKLTSARKGAHLHEIGIGREVGENNDPKSKEGDVIEVIPIKDIGEGEQLVTTEDGSQGTWSGRLRPRVDGKWRKGQ